MPNEEQNANTVKLEVDLPAKYPIASVSLQPMPGWVSTTETTTLAKPITTDVTQAVSKITFKALQTYSDGTTVAWIQPTVKGTSEPEHPAPTVTLTKATSGH